MRRQPVDEHPQDAVTEVDDAGVGCGDSALRQQFADGAVGNTAFAQRSNVLLKRQQS